MIEVVYQEERKEKKQAEYALQLPKNIRQIGLPENFYKIYMEDYVNIFLKKIAQETQERQGGGKYALLLGEIEYLEGIPYIFIRCALEIEQESSEEALSFDDKLWSSLNERIEEFFPGQEVVGWFFTAPLLPQDLENQFCKLHITHFGGEKVLLLLDAQEKEEAFFRYAQGKMSKQQGYYIYYEKNPQMQTYLISHSQNQSMESEQSVQDKAVKKFRKKHTEKTGEEQSTGSSWATIAVAAITVLILASGSTFLRSYDKMNETREEVREISAQIFSEKEEASALPTEIPIAPPQETKTMTMEETEQKSQIQQAQEESGEGEETQSQSEAPEREAENTANTFRMYQIQEGDTLNKISMRIYGSLDYVEQICEMNQIEEGETIYPGERIVLP